MLLRNVAMWQASNSFWVFDWLLERIEGYAVYYYMTTTVTGVLLIDTEKREKHM